MLPSISIITPSFNQASYLEATLTSVLDSHYENLEYLVLDGASSDGSRDILERYAERLSYWHSRKDEGQYAAIQEGFERSSGEIMGWLNSDDMYFPWTLKVVGEIFASFPQVEWISTLHPAVLSAENVPVHLDTRSGYSQALFQKGWYAPDGQRAGRMYIQQESTFWRRSLWERCGAKLSGDYSLAADFELWARFFQESDLVGVRVPLAGFRSHGEQKSVQQMARYHAETQQILKEAGGQQESGIAEWIRRRGLGARWPLRVLPSLGFIQPVQEIHWAAASQSWELSEAWIDC